MKSSTILQFPEIGIFAQQFESGARKAAECGGLTVVIDVFRASNTMLELLQAGAVVCPVTDVSEAMHQRYNDHIRIGEDEGRHIASFQYDNSPVTISNNRSEFDGRKVVLRTTNGTKGIQASLGSDQIVVGSFRNHSAVVDYALEYLQSGNDVHFIAMGTLEEARIEDDYCANMFVIRMLEKLGEHRKVDEITDSDLNPWVRDWANEILEERGDNFEKIEDYRFSLELDKTDIIPIFDPQSNYLSDLSHQ